MRRKKINPTLEQLSPRERAALEYLQGYRKGRYRVPTIREISTHIGLSVSSTHDLIRRLETYGYVERRNWPSGGRRRRNIRLLPQAGEGKV